MRELDISDAVEVQGQTGLFPGIYHIEGGEIHYTPDTGQAKMRFFVSRRGRRVFLQDDAVAVTPASDAWVDVGPPVALTLDDVFVVAADVRFPDAHVRENPDVAVLRLTLDGAVLSLWLEADIPTDESRPLASVAAGPGQVRMQVRRSAVGATALTADRVRVVRIDS